jgi:hypothetical protein
MEQGGESLTQDGKLHRGHWNPDANGCFLRQCQFTVYCHVDHDLKPDYYKIHQLPEHR